MTLVACHDKEGFCHLSPQDVPFFQNCVTQYTLVFTKVYSTIFFALYSQGEPQLVSSKPLNTYPHFSLDIDCWCVCTTETFLRSHSRGSVPKQAARARELRIQHSRERHSAFSCGGHALWPRGSAHQRKVNVDSASREGWFFKQSIRTYISIFCHEHFARASMQSASNDCQLATDEP